jgi:hypothetical protein
MGRGHTIAVAGQIAAGALGLNHTALADGDQGGREARALSLFIEGRTAMAAGHYTEACPKFADSKTLDPGAGTMLNLAYCYEKLGRDTEAWVTYRAAAVAAHEHGRTDWENAARARAERLEGRLVWVVVHVEKQADPGLLAMRLDGAPMTNDVLERPIPVDMGHHEVRVTSVGRRPWSVTFDADGEHVSTITIPALEAIENPESRMADSAQLPPVSDASSRSGASARRTAAWAMGGAGVAALATGTVLALVAKTTYGNADCAGNACTAPGNAAQSRAFLQADIATAIALAGAAALGGAAVLWLTAPTPKATMAARPTAGGAQLGMSVGGTW